jgi:hypothetical protein
MTKPELMRTNVRVLSSMLVQRVVTRYLTQTDTSTNDLVPRREGNHMIIWLKPNTF